MNDGQRCVSIEIPVAWGDMDAFGHVNNVVYFRWFESARIALFEAVAIPHEEITDRCAPILAKTTCEFILPLRYPDTIRAEAGITTIGNRSFTMRYTIHSTAHDAVAAQGEGVVVWYDYKTAKPTPIPEDLRTALARYT